MSNFAKFLLGWDRLGHRFSLNYGGNETHNTWLGTFFSMCINVLVLIILVQKMI